MATFKVLLDTRRQLEDGTYPLVIRIFNGRKFRDMSLKTHLKEAEFDSENQKVRGKHPHKKLINQKISKAILQLQQTSLNLEMADEVVTSEKIKNLVVKPQSKLDFIQFGWGKVDELIQSNHYGNACIYRDALNSLLKYSGKLTIAFRDINYQFLKQLENKMLSKGIKVNSIAMTLRTIRAIYNRAIKEKQVDKSYYPFDEFRVKWIFHSN